MTRPPPPRRAERRRLILGAAAALALPAAPWRPALAATPADTTASPADPSRLPADCVIPAKAGGGFALTCALARDALQAVRPQRAPLGQRFLPGGIGAVAFDQVATGRLGGAGTLVAFSGGSLLNIAQGRFGPHPVSAVRWLALLGADYGVIAVHRDSPYRQLQDLVQALSANPARIAFGAGGTVGSQDWVKAALLVRASGGDHRRMRFVAFEGGGDALNALQGRHVDVFCGDAAEAAQAVDAGAALRFLAVFSAQRLGGVLQGVPTAREQGIDIVWPTVRGLYVSADVPEPALQAWTVAFDEATKAPGYAQLLARHALYPFALTGPALDRYVADEIDKYQALAAELGLRRWGRPGS
ncbi:tripartite tricarboxylate transporter substrate binding protein [uncultured Pseudacidovorax sp.]|uniref:Bug family tripartite tricarboxylate transporter substrate binding protein n=1 Tax=uncultured Pseudacidovorax sp. TaxID=679313 RepID=UPI0025F4EF67|nr:tripartite tricarboxylate transporter substrate-binding protein [uncultured Pseudacidovorax sp.]